MVLIVSDEHDVSANRITDLLNYNKIPIFQIKNNHIIQIESVIIKSGILQDFKLINTTTNKSLNKSDISSFLYRKGELSPKIDLRFLPNIDNNIKRNLANGIISEWNALVYFIFDYIEKNIPSVGNYNNTVPNKLEMLTIAARCGFKVPETHILTDINLKFGKNDKSYICKSIQDITVYIYNNILYASYTSKLNENILDNDYFCNFPSLIQEKIDCKFEIRTFFFDQKIYSCAIINNHYDYRISNDDIDIVPYLFTLKEEALIRGFISSCPYNSGSIDIIYTKKKELYFLEINPVGQFDFISDYCGRNIESDIVEFLSKR